MSFKYWPIAAAAMISLGVAAAQAGEVPKPDAPPKPAAAPKPAAVPKPAAPPKPAAAPKPAEPPIKPAEYWLGIVVSVPLPPLRAQLKLPKDEGLVVEHVAADSPAAKAGVQQYDVLLRAGDQSLGTVPDLIGVLDRGKDKALSIEFLHAGKKSTTTLTPTKRPPGQQFEVVLPPGASADQELIRQWLARKLPEPKPGPDGVLRMDVVQPGLILPPGAPLPPGMQGKVNVNISMSMTLPGGYDVGIHRDNEKPARILVKQGEQRWEATEGNLSPLPEKVRHDVERALQAGPVMIRAMTVPLPPGVAPGTAEASPQPNVIRIVVPPADIQRQVMELQRQVEQLRRTVEQLKVEVAPPAPAKDEAKP
jgi:hypothetical protein